MGVHDLVDLALARQASIDGAPVQGETSGPSGDIEDADMTTVGELAASADADPVVLFPEPTPDSIGKVEKDRHHDKEKDRNACQHDDDEEVPRDGGIGIEWLSHRSTCVLRAGEGLPATRRFGGF